MSNIHGTQRPRAWSDQGIGISNTFLAKQPSGKVQAGNNGTAVAGHIQNDRAGAYAKKPSIKKFFTDLHTYQVDASLHKKQRVAKHRDFLVEALVVSRDELAPQTVLARLKKLSSVSHGEPFRFTPTIPKDASERKQLQDKFDLMLRNIKDVRNGLSTNDQPIYGKALQVLESACQRGIDRLKDVGVLEKKAADFANQSVDVSADAAKNWQFSGDGKAGAILATKDKRIDTVMKVEADPRSIANAVAICGVVSQIGTQASGALPFEFAHHKVVTLDGAVAQATAPKGSSKAWSHSLMEVKTNLQAMADAKPTPIAAELNVARASALLADIQNLENQKKTNEEIADLVLKKVKEFKSLVANHELEAQSGKEADRNGLYQARETHRAMLAATAPLLAMSGKLLDATLQSSKALDKSTSDEFITGVARLAQHWQEKADDAAQKIPSLTSDRDTRKEDWKAAELKAAPLLPQLRVSLSAAQKKRDDFRNDKTSSSADSEKFSGLEESVTSFENAIKQAQDSAAKDKPTEWKLAESAWQAFGDAQKDLKAKLNEVENAKERKKKVEATALTLTPGTPILVQTGVSGVVASGAPAAEKFAAIDDRSFGLALGQSCITGTLAGIGEHIPPNGMGQCNFGNVMLRKNPPTGSGGNLPAPATYQLGLIDFTAPQNKPEIKQFRALVTDLKRLAKAPHERLSDAMSSSGVSELHTALLKGGNLSGGSFLTPAEAKALTPNSKNRCAGNILAGIALGIEYFERNQAVFAKAHAAAGGSFDAEYLAAIAHEFARLHPSERQALKNLSSDSAPTAPPSYEASLLMHPAQSAAV